MTLHLGDPCMLNLLSRKDVEDLLADIDRRVEDELTRRRKTEKIGPDEEDLVREEIGREVVTEVELSQLRQTRDALQDELEALKARMEGEYPPHADDRKKREDLHERIDEIDAALNRLAS